MYVKLFEQAYYIAIAILAYFINMYKTFLNMSY